MTRAVLLASLLVACSSPPESPAAPSSPATATAGAAGATAKGSRKDITIDEFIADTKAGGIQIVDVRTDEEWGEGHVPNAVHIPIDALRADHPDLAKLDKSKPIYFICAVGGRSAKASDMMAGAGITAVNVKGGTNAWVAKGQPLSKETP